jgi:hypothetical protein
MYILSYCYQRWGWGGAWPDIVKVLLESAKIKEYVLGPTLNV